jgi:hypothetical protein
MRLILVLVALALAHPSWDELVRVRASEMQLTRERAELATRLQEQAHAVEEQKARAKGPVERARLEATLAEAQRLARQLATLDGALAARRRELMAAADRVIEGERDAGLRAQAVQVRADMARALAAPARSLAVGAILGLKEAATDGPDELRAKADLLKDTEDRIQRELAALDKRYGAAQRRNELQRSMRNLESSPFLEDTRRQRAEAQVRGNGAAGEPNRGAGAPGTGGDFGAPTPGQTGGGTPPSSGGGDLSGPSPPPGAGLVPQPGSSTDVLALKDLLDAATLGDLGQPKDSARYLRALERARSRLRAVASDLEQRSQVLRRRADELRKTR